MSSGALSAVPISAQYGLETKPSILLTGATGYLGTHVLERLLLSEPNTAITCAIRASSVTEARNKLNHIWRESNFQGDTNRVEIINLGIYSWEVLAAYQNTFSCVIHCAVDKNALASEADLWEVNVEPALHVLATLTPTGRFLFCSSIAVAQEGSCVHTTNGYALSKRATEDVLLQRAQPGQEVVVYRLPALFPDASSPRWNKKDFIARVVGLSLKLQAFPVLDESIEVPWIGVSRASGLLAEVASDPRGSKGGYRFAEIETRYSEWNAIARLIKKISQTRLITWDAWLAEGLTSLRSRAEMNEMRAVRAVSKFYLVESTQTAVRSECSAELEDSLEAGIQWSENILRRRDEDTAQANVSF